MKMIKGLWNFLVFRECLYLICNLVIRREWTSKITEKNSNVKESNKFPSLLKLLLK